MRALYIGPLVALLGCGPSTDVSFVLSGVSPGAAAFGSEATVRIEGRAFYARAAQRIGADDGEPASSYRAWLGEVELANVRRLSPSALEATVPGTLALGVHPLRVQSPFEAEAVLPDAFTVVEPEPAALSMTLTAPAAVNIGQAFEVRATVANTGGRGARSVTPAALTLSTARANLISGPAPADATIPALRSVAFTWTLTGADSGVVIAETSASGIDSWNGASVSTPLAQSGEVLVQRRSALSGSISDPNQVDVGDTFTVGVVVLNDGEATANAVTPSALSCTGTATLTIVSGPTPGAAPIAGGEFATFSYTVRADAAGTAQCSATAAGVDANDGEPVQTGTMTSGDFTVRA